jgi:hypothetical protein
MTMTVIPICLICKHLRRDRHGLPYCRAFPDGNFPKEILFGESFHERPFKTQKTNIVFELDESAPYELRELFKEVLR